MIDEAVRTTIYKARINKKYPFKNMSLGETFKLKILPLRQSQTRVPQLGQRRASGRTLTATNLHRT